MSPGAAPGRRILVVANETAASEALRDVVGPLAEGAVVLVVAPALVSRLRYWTSDDDEAREAAAERLRRCLDSLRDCGAHARGHVGDANPLQAIDDALRLFDADELIIATHRRGRSNWLTQDIVARARRRFGLPVHHLAVEGERELVAAAA